MKISNTHHRTMKGVVKRNPVRIQSQIGDGKLPNKYWVSYSNAFYICKEGSCDWADDSINYKVTGKTLPIAYKTFREALQKARELSEEMTDKPEKSSINNIRIYDRLTGEVYENGIFAYPVDVGLLTGGFKVEIEERIDTGFTENEMTKRGVRFE